MTYMRTMFMIILLTGGFLLETFSSISKTWDYMNIEPAKVTATLSDKDQLLAMRALKDPEYNISWLALPATLIFSDGSTVNIEYRFKQHQIKELVNGNTINVLYNKSSRTMLESKPDIWKIWRLATFLGIALIACIFIRLQFYSTSMTFLGYSAIIFNSK